MNILGIIFIIIGIIFVIYSILKNESLSMNWLLGVTVGYAIIVIGICLLNVYVGYKNIAIILLAFLGIGTMMKTRINLIYQVLINVLFVIVAIILIALLNVK